MSSVKLMNPFDPRQVDPSQGGGQLPLGRHHVVIESGSVDANKANTGGFLQLNLKIIDGDFAGQSGRDILNLYHPNPKTVEIANRRLSAYCHVTGQFQLGADGCDVSVLFNIPFYIDVVNQKLTDEQEAAKARGETVKPYTEISKLYDNQGKEPGKGGGQPAQQQQQPQQAQQQQPAQQQAAAGWGNPQQQQQPAQQPQQAAWGGQQQPAQQEQQQVQQQQPANAGWQQNTGGQTQQAAPWGAKS